MKTRCFEIHASVLRQDFNDVGITYPDQFATEKKLPAWNPKYRPYKSLKFSNRASEKLRSRYQTSGHTSKVLQYFGWNFSRFDQSTEVLHWPKIWRLNFMFLDALSGNFRDPYGLNYGPNEGSFFLCGTWTRKVTLGIAYRTKIIMDPKKYIFLQFSTVNWFKVA